MNALHPTPYLPVVSTTTVRLEEISKVYDVGETKFQALTNIHLTIEQGEYCAIMGTSGSGKSTLMSIMGCLDRPSSGHYYLHGLDVASLGDRELAYIRNQNLGFVFQQFHLLPQLSALENVMLPLIYAGADPTERGDRARLMLKQVGLENRLHSKPNQLSGGQQQRVAIARAMVNQPVLLLADEPTGALDSHTSQEVMDIFSTLHTNGITVIVVTHELEIAHRAQRIIHLNDGQVMV